MNPPIIPWTKSDIRTMFSSTIFQRGMTYYREGRVYELQYDRAEQLWRAAVQGTSLYHVTIRIDDTFTTTYCECPAHDRYGSCKHVVAVFLDMCDLQEDPDRQRDEEGVPTTKDDRLVTQLIKAFSTHHDDIRDASPYVDPESQRLKVEFICKSHPLPLTSMSDQNLLTIEMKTGVQRLYVVKKLKGFLDSVFDGHAYEFTKRFTYDPTVHVFADEDWEIIEILREISLNEAILHHGNASYSYMDRAVAHGRAMIVPPLVAEKLLRKLQARNSHFEHEGIAYPRIAVSEGTLPFSFPLDEMGPDTFQLDLSDVHAAMYFKSYGLVFYGGTFYSLSPTQRRLMEELTSITNTPTLSRRPVLPMTKEQIGPFLSHVTPELQKIGTMEITDRVSDQIVRHPLQAKVYVADEEETVSVHLEYHYGDVKVNPFDPQGDGARDHDQIVIRDTEKEQAIMQAIENSPLKIKGQQLYMEKTEDALYDLLYGVLPVLAEQAEVYMSEAIHSLMLPEKAAPVTSVDLDASGNWLEVSFDMEGINATDVQKILKSVVEKKRYYRLPSGAFVSLEDEAFQPISKLLAELNVRSSELAKPSMILPLYRGLQVQDVMAQGSPHTTRFGRAYRRLIQHLRHPDELDVKPPGSLASVLRDYQTKGFQWLKTLAHYRLGGILADDMGLGKTLQTIAYILSEKQEGQRKQLFLVVAPASLIYNWKNEFDKFAPTLDVTVVAGTPAERDALLQQSAGSDVWITSYPLLRQDIEQYRAHEFDALILDEAQAIKNPQTKTFAAVCKVKAARRFALSGTPIENALTELWSIFQAIMPGFFPNQTAFRKLSPDQVAKRVRPFILRRVKKDVLKELPDKIETVHLSELNRKQKELYLGYLERTRQETKEALQQGGLAQNRMKILAALTRLRQICCHPALFIENYADPSGKLEQLMEIASQAVASGKRLLIFSQFTSMLSIIGDALQKRGFDYFYLDGKTPSKERVNMAEAFNSGEKEMFLISLKAGGTGLNLTGADTVILYDLWWNPAVEEQAAGRAHRLGQKHVVHVMRLIARGTIEEKMYDMQQKKKELIEQVIQPGETMLTSLSEEEIREILNI